MHTKSCRRTGCYGECVALEMMGSFCPVCGEDCGSPDELEYHINEVHDGQF